MGVLDTLSSGALEMLYPTRCVLCDLPGSLLCTSCGDSLELIDHARACPRCGAPGGAEQCTECEGDFPFTAARAIGSFDNDFSRIITVYKDLGERRLSEDIARLLAIGCGADWRSWADAATFIPATNAAYRRRGFDHMERVARRFCEMTHIPFADLLIKHDAADQRTLGRAERARNASSAYEVVDQAARHLEGADVLLIDDVLTTGATLAAATEALIFAGMGEVRVLVLARVW